MTDKIAIPRCGAKTRALDKHCCRYPAGFKTDHPGEGRCWLHGGKTPIKHGRYSKIKRREIRDLVGKFLLDPEPLNMLDDLAAMRALFVDFVQRYGAWREALLAWHDSWKAGENGPTAAPKPREIMDVADAHRILAEVTKVVERIERIKAANAISRSDLARVVTEMARSVERYVIDPAFTPEERIRGIRDAWLSIRLG